MSINKADTKADIEAAPDREEAIASMEPLLVSDDSRHRGSLTDLSVDLVAKASGFRRSLSPGIRVALATLVGGALVPGDLARTTGIGILLGGVIVALVERRRELDAMHDHLRRLLPVDGVLLCPHDESDRCSCRKPGAGLFTEAAFRWHLDLDRSFVDRYNHELIDIHRITPEGMQANLQHLQHLIEKHVAETGSVWGAEILRDFRNYIGHFWVVKPKAASIESLIENLSRAA